MGKGMLVDSSWLPFHIDLSRHPFRVTWIRKGPNLFSEPFFHDTVNRLRSLHPSAEERATGSQDLLALGAELPAVKPLAFIFHISRCGSTLIANSFREAEGV